MVVLLIAGCAARETPAAPEAEPVTVQLLAFNDFHGYLEPPGALTLPEGRRFLLADFMSQWKFLTANADDNILPPNLTALGNRSSDVCAQFEPNGLQVFTGLWCSHSPTTILDCSFGRNALWADRAT